MHMQEYGKGTSLLPLDTISNTVDVNGIFAMIHLNFATYFYFFFYLVSSVIFYIHTAALRIV